MKKLFALIRFVYFKLFTGGLRLNKVSYIGRSALLQCSHGGSIDCAGKIRLDAFSEIGSQGELRLGHNFVINPYSRVIAHEKITIGDNVVIARFVSVLDHDHAMVFEGETVKYDGYNTAPIRIGDNVWLGDKVTVLKGVSIGNNVIVAANSVVTKDVPPNVIVGGIPAKVLKKHNV